MVSPASSRASLMQAVKFHPGVLPWMVLVRKVGVDLLGINQEPFPAFNLVGVGFSFGIRGYEGACAGYAVVEQIVPGVGTIRAAVHVVPSRIDITLNPRNVCWEIWKTVHYAYCLKTFYLIPKCRPISSYRYKIALGIFLCSEYLPALKPMIM